ncbi:GNAT family N-acetyltransferase [Thioclava sp. GXIMD2076]|uniref:GNAT family N-acetyltransferase n=1 Tax=Thioclava sp. GXIMD2076 TaxID=3131931 RepID=UPI0030CBC46B
MAQSGGSMRPPSRKELAVRFCDAGLEDVEELAQLHVQAWRDTYTGLLPQAMLDQLDLRQRMTQWHNAITHKAGRSGTGVVLARAGGDLLGFVSYGPQRDADLALKGYDGEIEALYVQRNAQGRGLGRALLGHAGTRLQAAGFGAAALWVLEANAPACAFYAAMGAEICDTRIELRPEATLQDRAYGWRDLEALTAAGG